MKALLAGFTLLVAAPVAAAVPTADYRATAVESSEGWTFGKATAPLLTEYASFGCPHCGQYAAQAGDRIDQLVKTGKLRFSWRPFLIFPQDRAAAVLTRCIAPSRRLAFIKAVMAKQNAIRTALSAADQDEAQRSALYEVGLRGPVDEAAEVAKASGLLALAQGFGLTKSAASACLANPAHHAWVTDADMTARLNGIKGTPTFILKGVRLPAGTQEDLIGLLPR